MHFESNSGLCLAVISGLGPGEAIAVAVVMFLAIGFLRPRSTRLVMKVFDLDPTGTRACVLEIVGRPAGVISWVLSQLNFGHSTYFKVMQDHINFSSHDLKGKGYVLVPINRLVAVHSSFSKPFWSLVMGIVFIASAPVVMIIAGTGLGLLALIPGALLLLFGALLLLHYWLSRELTLSFETAGGAIHGLTLVPSVLHGTQVTLPQATQAVELLQAMMQRVSSSSPPPPNPVAIPVSAPSTPTMVAPSGLKNFASRLARQP